jgi:proteasome accessory factor A
MAVPKVMGLETEYGAHIVGRERDHRDRLGLTDWSPDSVTAALVYLAGVAGRGWSSTPANRHYFFPNGGLLYRDVGDHPEYATPECLTATELVAHDRAGEVVLAAALRKLFERRETHGRFSNVDAIGIYKHNVDFSGNTFGTHENFCVAASLPIAEYAASLAPFLCTRPIIAGSGGLRWSDRPGQLPSFTLSPRADAMRFLVGSRSTSDRPMVLRRPEPHADPVRYRRLQLLCGDSNRCEISTFLKMGTTAIVLAMIEDGYAPRGLELADPVRTLHQVAGDSTLKTRYLVGNQRLTALEVQVLYFEAAEHYSRASGLEACGGESGKQVLDQWRSALELLDAGRTEQLFGVLDWITRREIFSRTIHRAGPIVDSSAVDSVRTLLAGAELAYSSIDALGCGTGGSTYEALRSRGRIALVGGGELRVTDPGPERTRAGFRGELVRSAQSSLVSLNWSSVQLKLGSQDVLMPLPEPVLSDGPQLMEIAATSDGEFVAALGRRAPHRLIDIAASARRLERFRPLATAIVSLMKTAGDPGPHREALAALGRSAVENLAESVSSYDTEAIGAYVEIAAEIADALGERRAASGWIAAVLESNLIGRRLSEHARACDPDDPYPYYRSQAAVVDAAREAQATLHRAREVLERLGSRPLVPQAGLQPTEIER